MTTNHDLEVRYVGNCPIIVEKNTSFEGVLQAYLMALTNVYRAGLMSKEVTCEAH